MADGALGSIVAVPSGPTIPVTEGFNGQGSTSTPTPVNQSGGQVQNQGGQTSVASGWTVKDPDLLKVVQSKKWNSPEDALRSYIELEKTYHKVGGESREMKELINLIAPHWEDIQAFLLEKQQKAAQGQRIQNGDGKQGQDPNLQELIERATKPLNDQLRQVSESTRRSIVNQATKSFMDTYPDAKEIESDIADIIKGKVVNVQDPGDPDSVFAAYEAAYNIVKAKQITRKAAGARASGVEGGQGKAPDVSTRNMSLGQLRDYILSEGQA